MAFMAAKNALQANTLLVHYNHSRPLILACDASPYGLGAVLSQDGTERPVAYDSRTLTAAEKNYSQLEKEGLAVVYGVKKFHQYLWGRHFFIESDHQPLSPVWRIPRDTSNGISQDSKMGSHVECLPLHYQIQSRCTTKQCRCSQSTSTTTNHYFRSLTRGTSEFDRTSIRNNHQFSEYQALDG